ncbi:MAG: hypothetical protein P8J32_03125 [bacterium]|nr:hypothetical protein [bacterium]
MKKDITNLIRHPETSKNAMKFCSRKCAGASIQVENIPCSCTNCFKPIEKTPSEFRKTKNHFCSRSCSATFNNRNKNYGTRRSKLESWIESKLIQDFPDIKLHFNQSDAIGSELDIYIPSLRLAFELNGIFHYKPIFGEEKLNKIKNNDKSKKQACDKLGIELVTIDTSQQTKVTAKTSKPYLNMVTEVIKQRSSSI